MKLRNIRKARVLVFAFTAATVLWQGPAWAAPDIRLMSDYGYVALQRQEGCVFEELWTGLNYISSASLAPGEAWSEPTATAWVWYHTSNECTSQDVAAYGEMILDPASYDIVSLGDLSFHTQIQLSEVNSGESPPFLGTGPSDWSGTSFGTVELDLVFTQEGPFHTFNLMNGILIPPPGTGPGAPGSRTAWLYTGASVSGSISGSIEFGLEAILFAEIGSFTLIAGPDQS
jgi:hypothetical protein